MAEIIASELLKLLVKKLASEVLKTYARSQGIRSELKKLERTLSQIQSLLNDASQKEIKDGAVKQWLNGLQHLAYDIDDVLDDLATEATHHEFTQQSGAMTNKVRMFIPSCCTNLSLSQRMYKKLDNIATKLQDLEKEKVSLGLVVKDEKSKRIYQTSLVDTSSIVGREEEKNELVVKLLGDEPGNQNFSIVPIVGMGGLGKTTLARLLYDDEEVKNHFELKAWACVSDEFDIFSIRKVILQSVTGENKDFTDLNLLQVDLKNQLKEKRFLIVLDDVWSESYEEWETLVSPFHECAPGSKIIMTTRKVQLLEKLGCNHINHLQTLSHDDAISLFAQHALGANNFDSHPMLMAYGEGIVKKCDGLPLALRVLGRLLRTKTEEEEWKELLNSEIWNLGKGDEIVPALRLSYHDLSSCMKQLFAYCSLFPKDCVFDKENLILLWMAEGFLHQPSSSKSMERLGLEYFQELLSRSLIQHAPNDKSSFMMHDLLNDLATCVAGDFFLRLEHERVKDGSFGKEALFKFRHLSFVREKFVAYTTFEPFKSARSLRTFLAVEPKDSWRESYLSSKVMGNLLPELPLLRVLSLSDYKIIEVPDTIGNLKHLRYLNLSRTLITQLPENVGNLYNLQTLILFGCIKLSKLPNNFSKLKNLRHMDIRDTLLLNKMPLGVGELKSLHTLSKIIIGRDNGLVITELKNLTNLHGKTHIKGLEQVELATHAREAKLLQKRFSELDLEWSDVFDDSRKESLEKEVLNVLKPRNDSLIKLGIVSYVGKEFPSWVGDPSFLHLISVSICGCKKCTSLPPLGQLPSLKKLFIEDMDEVRAIGSELAGTGYAFPSLEILKLRNMKTLLVWSTRDGVVSFPCLQKLVIRNCPNLVEVSPEELPSLNVLKIYECNSEVLRRLVQLASGVTEMKIEKILGLNDVVWRGVTEYLGAVEKLIIRLCHGIRYLWHGNKVLNNLKDLEVWDCRNLVRLEEKEDGDNCGSNLIATLRKLKIVKCRSMEHCRCPDNIEELNISGCNSITSVSFPTQGRPKLKFLTILSCDKLLKKELEGDNITGMLINNQHMPMLQNAAFVSWRHLTTMIELSHFIHLTYLIIHNCPNLKSFPDHELPNLTSLKYLGIYKCPHIDASFPRGCGFWPPKLNTLVIGELNKPILEWGTQNFPSSLINLRLRGGLSEEDGVSSCDQLSNLIPSSLTALEIFEFKKLKSLSEGLQHLTSLQHLAIWDCPEVMRLPEVLLPSLLSLRIMKCLNLEESCDRRGSYWSHISHIPCIRINT